MCHYFPEASTVVCLKQSSTFIVVKRPAYTVCGESSVNVNISIIPHSFGQHKACGTDSNLLHPGGF